MNAPTQNSRNEFADPSSISSALLDQIRSRRPDGWRRLVDLYGPTVYCWSRQLGLNDTDAADVVQEVFAAVAVGLARFRRDRPGDSFGGWLRTITRNKVNDHFRRRRGIPNAEGGTDAYRQLLEHPESFDGSSIQTAKLCTDSLFARRAMDVVRAEFEQSTWDAFWRIVVDGRSPVDVAESLGMSLAAVYQAKSRVLRRLRREMQDSRE